MSKPKRKLVNKILLFVMIGLVPGLFLYIFSKGKQEFTTLDYLGPEEIVVDSETGEKSSQKFAIKDFEMRMWDGSTKYLTDFKNKIIVALVIGKSCPDDCEIHNEGYERVLLKGIKGNGFKDVVVLVEYVDYDSDVKPSMENIHDYYSEDTYLQDQVYFFQCDTNKLFDFKPAKDAPNVLRERMSGMRNGKAYYQFGVLIDKKGHPRMLHLTNGSKGIRDILNGIKVLFKEEAYEKD